jgi:hypothetical protein
MEELDELRIAIAKAKGWKIYDMVEDKYLSRYLYPLPPGAEIDKSIFEEVGVIDKPLHWRRDAPDWPRDIAAAYELEAEIPEDQRKAYTGELIAVIAHDCKEAGINSNYWMYFHATPEQRCRAYLAWKEAQAVEDGG